jgi:serine/threonine-protein kinase
VRTFGKYRLLEPIASGGMADVWRAEVTGAEGVVKEVALKLVRGEHAARSDFVRMFVQEARLAARLGHANVVQVFEFDQVDGRYYIAMELVRGRHLGRVAERARERGVRFGVARILQVGVEVARALSYAHRLSEGGRPVGLVHRDVSPHNVLVSFEGEVKLADFGIARAMDRGGLTDPGTMKGKVAYMAPEQARGAAVDGRADVFSLGVVLWELCTGRRLFARESEAATLSALLSAEPVSPPSAWNEEVPPELDRAVLGALEREPGRRTASAQDLATALGALLLRVARSPEDVDLRAFMRRLFADEIAALEAAPPEPTRVRPVAMAAEPVAERSLEAEAEGAGDTGTPTVVAPRRGRRWVAAGASAATGAAIAAALLVGTTPSPEPAPPPARGSGGASLEAIAIPAATATASPTPSPPPAPPEAQGGAGASLEASAPDAAPRAGPGRGRAGIRPLAAAAGLGALELPSPASGEGLLGVNATPWGRVRVNGHLAGDTPLEVRLPAGRHRVRIERNGRPPVEAVVTVRAGARTRLLR